MVRALAGVHAFAQYFLSLSPEEQESFFNYLANDATTKPVFERLKEIMNKGD